MVMFDRVGKGMFKTTDFATEFLKQQTHLLRQMDLVDWHELAR